MYSCKDCSYEGKQAKQGRCPACGSARIMKIGQEGDEEKKTHPIQLVLLISLWAVLFWLIYRNLQG